MQRGRTPRLQLSICNLDADAVDHIDFMFKQERSENCDIQVLKRYPGEDVTLDENGVYNIQWTAEETRVFAPNKNFYLDVRPVDKDGNIIETVMVTLTMNDTLFKAGE